MRKVIWPLIFAALAPVGAEEPTRPGSLEGRVANRISGEAIPGADVIVGCMSLKDTTAVCTEHRTKSERDGHFKVEGLQAGSYLLIAYADRYVQSGLTPSTTLEANEQRSDIVLELDPVATIRGKVLDENGSPAPGAKVQALIEQRDGLTRHLRRVKTSVTDGNGLYQLDELSAGNYFIAVENGDAGFRCYFPSSINADEAQPIQLRFGQEYSDATVRLRTVTLRSITGSIAGLDALPSTQRLVVSLHPHNLLDEDSLQRQTEVDAEGRFRFDYLLAGNYVLSLQSRTVSPTPGSQQGARFFHVLGKLEIQVGQNDVAGIVLAAMPKVNVTGRVVLEHATDEELASTEISLSPAETFPYSDYKNTRASQTGTFTFEGCDPARHSVLVVAPNGTYVEQIEYNRQITKTRFLDFSNGAGSEIVVTLQRGVAGLTGTLADGARGAFVLVAPADWTAGNWREPRKAVASEGSFSFPNLAPGTYVVVATYWLHRDSSELTQPDVIQALMQEGERIELAPGLQNHLQLHPVTEDTVAQIAARLGL